MSDEDANSEDLLGSEEEGELEWESDEEEEGEDGEEDEESSEDEEDEEDVSSDDYSGEDGEDVEVAKERELSLREKEAHIAAIHADDLESDDDTPLNTIGNVPLRWYDEYPHIGYNISGERIIKKDRDGDNLDALVNRADDPNYKWTIVDEKNDREIVLTPREINLLRRMQTGQVAHVEHDPFPGFFCLLIIIFLK